MLRRCLFAVVAALIATALPAQVDPRESTGMVPLTDLGPGKYKGEQGGLYPGGANIPPAGHLQAGVARGRAIARREASGKVALISIGMSNTTMEFQTLVKTAAGDSGMNPNLAIVDCAQSGQGADVTSKPDAKFWQVCLDRLQTAGIRPEQVAAAWIKQAYARPKQPFPAEPKIMQAYLRDTVHNLHDKFPNLQIAYFSSRIYAGYANTDLNPEPHAYEGAFAVKWLIAAQIAGDAELNYDPAKGPVRAPWLAWGPYLWADGVKGRRDGLVWLRSDLGNDGTHPSPAGREKVTKLLLDFFKSDATSRPWFDRQDAAGGAWESFPDGSQGRVADFQGAGGLKIPAYLRKPAGDGPFPVIVNLHGGGASPENTYRMGRAPNAEYLGAGWAVYAIDFRPDAAMEPVEWADTVAAVENVKRMPFIDGRRVAVFGGSHGGHVMARVASRVDAACGVLYSPTALDLGQMRRALQQEKDPATIERLQLIMHSFVDRVKDPEAFQRGSALTEAPRVRFPLLIIDGGGDISLPRWMVEEYAARLRAAGKSVETFLPEGLPHGSYSGNAPEAVEARRRTMKFLRACLQ